MIRTRFAPSPTGDLHVGGAWTALASYALARHHKGQIVLRVEDIDTPRVVEGSRERIERDLAWLGIRFDEGDAVAGGTFGPYTQSKRTQRYAKALEHLVASTYLCDCSRAEIARAASAPHEGEETVYPGTCSHQDPRREMKRVPAVRLRVPAGTTYSFRDHVMGESTQRIDTAVGDFVLQRGDGVYSYQLAVAVDDAEMGITDVVRGSDLLASTPRQILLMKLLELEPPQRYWHVPLVVSASGDRLAKRVREATIASLRERGYSPETIVGQMAFGLGLCADPAPRSADEVVGSLTSILFSRHAWTLPPDW